MNGSDEFQEITELFICKPKSSFLTENHQNDNKAEFTDFNEFILFMILKTFQENSHYRNGYLVKMKNLVSKLNF